MRNATTLTPAAIGGGSQAQPVGRGRLARRVILFQVKLFADGVRDVVMSPLSLAAGLIGILFGRSEPERPFEGLMRFGRETDRWINLFDAYEPAEEGRTLDTVADEIETAIRRDYDRGGISARSAEALMHLARQLRRRDRPCP